MRLIRGSVATAWIGVARRLLVVVVVPWTMTGCAVGDALRGDADVVARAGALQLHRDTLAAVFATVKSKPSRREVVEQWAYRWVEFALLGQRLAAGDSLLDSATVFFAMWPEADQWLVDDYHDALVAERVSVDSSVVDSAYATGNQRIIYHVLFRTSPDMAPPDKKSVERRGLRLLQQLDEGLAWETANEQSDDATAKREGGSLGVIERGQMVPPFEEAAFALAPGDRSDLVETPYGYHILWRPTLAEVRPEFAEAVEEALIARMDSVFLAELEARWDIKVRSKGPALMREAAAHPLRALQSSDVVGTYKGGRFTTADFIRWLQVLPNMVYRGVSGASDEQLIFLGQSLIRNEVLVREARDSGIPRMDEDYLDLRDQLRTEIEKVTERIGLDTALANRTGSDERRQAVEETLRRYFYDVAQAARMPVVVPAFLADKLRNDLEWDVSADVVDQVLSRAQTMWDERMAAADSSVPPAALDSVSDVPPQ